MARARAIWKQASPPRSKVPLATRPKSVAPIPAGRQPKPISEDIAPDDIERQLRLMKPFQHSTPFPKRDTGVGLDRVSQQGGSVHSSVRSGMEEHFGRLHQSVEEGAKVVQLQVQQVEHSLKKQMTSGNVAQEEG